MVSYLTLVLSVVTSVLVTWLVMTWRSATRERHLRFCYMDLSDKFATRLEECLEQTRDLIRQFDDKVTNPSWKMSASTKVDDFIFDGLRDWEQDWRKWLKFHGDLLARHGVRFQKGDEIYPD